MRVNHAQSQHFAEKLREARMFFGLVHNLAPFQYLLREPKESDILVYIETGRLSHFVYGPYMLGPVAVPTCDRSLASPCPA